MEQFITNMNNLQQMFSALISVLLKQTIFLICITLLMPYEKSEDLLLHCLMDKSTLILVIYNMKYKYLCFSLFGICQALTLNQLKAVHRGVNNGTQLLSLGISTIALPWNQHGIWPLQIWGLMVSEIFHFAAFQVILHVTLQSSNLGT